MKWPLRLYPHNTILSRDGKKALREPQAKDLHKIPSVGSLAISHGAQKRGIRIAIGAGRLDQHGNRWSQL